MAPLNTRKQLDRWEAIEDLLKKHCLNQGYIEEWAAQDHERDKFRRVQDKVKKVQRRQYKGSYFPSPRAHRQVGRVEN